MCEFCRNSLLYFCRICHLSAFLLGHSQSPSQTTCLLRGLSRFSRMQVCVTPWTAGSSVHGILKARIPAWVAISSSRGPSWTRGQTASLKSPALAGRFCTTGTTQGTCVSCSKKRVCTRHKAPAIYDPDWQTSHPGSPEAAGQSALLPGPVLHSPSCISWQAAETQRSAVSCQELREMKGPQRK